MKNLESNKFFLKKALELSVESVEHGGGPFGAVIVKNGSVISTGWNKVTGSHDPTAHAEVNAIRKAAKKLKDHDLSGCVIYCSCEPCPMCLGAIYWARIDHIYFANSSEDAARFGFDDSLFFADFNKTCENRAIPATMISCEDALTGFEEWRDKENKTLY